MVAQLALLVKAADRAALLEMLSLLERKALVLIDKPSACKVAAACCSLLALRPFRTTWAPAWPRARARAKPMPPEEPVTRAVRPCN